MVAVVAAGVVVDQAEDAGVPRPFGHLRIALPDTATSPYTTLAGPIPHPQPRQGGAEESAGRRGCWFNVSFPRFNAKLHCTEVPVTDLGALLQDAQSLVFGHEVAATASDASLGPSFQERHALRLEGRWPPPCNSL